MATEHKDTDSGSVRTHREETGAEILLIKNEYTILHSHLMHFSYHVIIDDIHVGVGHLHHYFDQHLSLLSRETCLSSNSIFQLQSIVIWVLFLVFLSGKGNKPFSSKSRTTACVSKKRLPPSGFKSYLRSLMEVLRSEINNNKMAMIKTGVFFASHCHCVFSYLVFCSKCEKYCLYST